MPTRLLAKDEKQRKVLAQRSLSGTVAAPSQTHAHTWIYIICICIAAYRKNLISFLFLSLSLALSLCNLYNMNCFLSSRGDVFALCDKLSWQQSRNFYIPLCRVRTLLESRQGIWTGRSAKLCYWSAQREESQWSIGNRGKLLETLISLILFATLFLVLIRLQISYYFNWLPLIHSFFSILY